MVSMYMYVHMCILPFLATCVCKYTRYRHLKKNLYIQLELRSKEDSQLVQRIVEALSAGSGGGQGQGGSLPEELEAELTPEVLARIEGQLIKAVMANGQLKVSV